MSFTLHDNGAFKTLKLDSDNYIETRKRIKHARELAKLNPNKMFSDTEVAYIDYCCEFLTSHIDHYRTQKIECLCVEQDYFSVFARDVISDRSYLIVSSTLKIAKRKQHNDAYRAKK